MHGCRVRKCFLFVKFGSAKDGLGCERTVYEREDAELSRCYAMINYLKNHPIKFVVYIAVLIPVLMFITYASLNYSGYCIAERRYFSDEEKIRLTVEYVNSRDGVHIDSSLSGHPKRIKYANADEFMKLNKECCSIGPRGGDGYRYPNFGRRIYGSISDTIVLDYLAKYVDEGGVERSKLVTEQWSISNCGRVW